MIDNFWVGIVFGIILAIIGRVIYLQTLKSFKRPGISLDHYSRLPRMNSRDLAYCINQIIFDSSPEYTINKISTKDKDGIVTIWFNVHDEKGSITDHRSISCLVDDSLPDTYPLNRRRKQSIL